MKPKRIPPGPDHPWDSTYLTRLSKKWKKGKIAFRAEVFYEAGGIFQVDIRGSGIGSISRITRIKFANATDKMFDRLCAEVSLVPCKICRRNRAFDPKVHRISETNRNGVCEKCFIKALYAEGAEAEKQERKEEDKIDARKKERGFAYKLVAWVHPKQGGDDYSITDYYQQKPTARFIKERLKKRRSAILDDYKVTRL